MTDTRVTFGVPLENRPGGRRVPLTPDGARALRASGARTIVEPGAGSVSGFDNAAREVAGARLADRVTLCRHVDVVVKVPEPLDDEPDLVQPGQSVFCQLRLAVVPNLVRQRLDQRVTAVANEDVRAVDGPLPLPAPMRKLSGRLANSIGASYLQADHGGPGVPLGGVPRVAPVTVTVLGCESAGSNAIRMAVSLGGRVVVFDRSVFALDRIEASYRGWDETAGSTPNAIAEAVRACHVVVVAALEPSARAQRLLSREMVPTMPRSSVLVNRAIARPGCSDTSRPTTHNTLTFVEYGVVHYAVPNMLALVARAATQALTQATRPYLASSARGGLSGALSDIAGLRAGVVARDGHLTDRVLAAELGVPAHPELRESLVPVHAGGQPERSRWPTTADPDPVPRID